MRRLEDSFDAEHTALLRFCAGPKPNACATIDFAVSRAVDLMREYRCGPMVHTRWAGEETREHGPAALALLGAAEEDHRELRPRAARFGGALERTIELLSAEEIEVLVLKGQAMARVVYDDLAYKRMNDVDIMVRPERYLEAAALLEARDYSLKDGPAGYLERRMWVHHWAPLESPEGVGVDLHWNITGKHGFDIDVERLWSRALPLRIGSGTAFRLSDLDQWVHQVVHFHFYRQRLQDVFDVVNALSRAAECSSDDELVGGLLEARAEVALYRSANFCQLFTESPVLHRIADSSRSPSRFWSREVRKRAQRPQSLLTHRGRYFGELERGFGAISTGQGLERLEHTANFLRKLVAPPIRDVQQLENQPELSHPTAALRAWHLVRLGNYYRAVI